MLDYLLHEDSAPINSVKVPHATKSLELKAQKTNEISQMKAMDMLGSQFSKKEDRIQAVADGYLKAGQFKEYCLALCQLNEWEKSLSFAPLVSMEFWQELSEQYADYELA